MLSVADFLLVFLVQESFPVSPNSPLFYVFFLI